MSRALTAVKIISEIHRIMLQDSFTKGVFREMDGFLVLMSVLSTLHDAPDPATPSIEVTVAGAEQSVDCSQLVFLVLSEALNGHVENEQFFRVSPQHALFTCISTSSRVV